MFLQRQGFQLFYGFCGHSVEVGLFLLLRLVTRRKTQVKTSTYSAVLVRKKYLGFHRFVIFGRVKFRLGRVPVGLILGPIVVLVVAIATKVQ